MRNIQLWYSIDQKEDYANGLCHLISSEINIKTSNLVPNGKYK